MDQIAMNIVSDKEALINKIKTDLIEIIDDPEMSTFLAVEKLGEDKFTGISIKAKSSVAVRMQFRKKTKSFIEFRIANSNYFPANDIQEYNDEWNKIELDTDESILNYLEPIAETYIKVLLLYEREYYGCCSRYLECSDAGYCVHPSKIKSQGCRYKINLEHGQIFYGKNKNTDNML